MRRQVTVDVEDLGTTTVVYYRGFTLYPITTPAGVLAFEVMHTASGRYIARGADAIAGVFSASAFVDTILATDAVASSSSTIASSSTTTSSSSTGGP